TRPKSPRPERPSPWTPTTRPPRVTKKMTRKTIPTKGRAPDRAQTYGEAPVGAPRLVCRAGLHGRHLRAVQRPGRRPALAAVSVQRQARAFHHLWSARSADRVSRRPDGPVP